MGFDDFDDSTYKVDHINPASKILFKKTGSKKWLRNKSQKKPSAESSKEHFKELSDAVEKAHEHLIKTKSPYRFCVYQEEDELFIDLVILNEEGKIGSIKKKNITNDEFTLWLKMVQTGEGLLFDKEV